MTDSAIKSTSTTNAQNPQDIPEEEAQLFTNKTKRERERRLKRYEEEAKEAFYAAAINPYKDLDPTTQATVQQLVNEQYSLEENKIKYPDKNSFIALSALTLQLVYSGFTEIAKKAHFTEEA